ncbi:galactoside alpha-(1,2)-fucosyltransferase 2-like [Hetaerina americana]|uniref:galactoside alpha-(1,2)-fucosyltransferase 2-like n=1 Tax=Hetaerina americana TaxID=62018 RepID=UPI003A7F3C73
MDKSIWELKKMYVDGNFTDVVVLPMWTARMEILSADVKKFRRLFHLRSDVLELVKKTITGVLASASITGEVSLVGVHVRRNDYHSLLIQILGNNVSFATRGYFKRAMKKMRKLSPDTPVVFVVVSDDREWCMKELVNEREGVFWGGMEKSPFHDPSETQNTLIQPSHDFALLASLNGSIISYGTYAPAGALLAGGHTIMYDLQEPVFSNRLNLFTVGKYLENWDMVS